MSTAAEPSGFVVITEVSPKGAEEASSKTPPKRDPLQQFYKGEPLALGITQILCGVIHILFGIVSDLGNKDQPGWYIFLFHTGTPFWYGIMSIASGSLSVAATKAPRIGLVRGSLVMNIITAVASGIATIIYAIHIVNMDNRSYYRYFCNIEGQADVEKCLVYSEVHNVNTGIIGILLCLTILGMCLSISTSAFGCKTLCRTSYSEVSVVIYQTSAPQQSQPNVSTVQTSHTNIGANQPSFKEEENAWSSAPI